jgi:hypothetical protein
LLSRSIPVFALFCAVASVAQQPDAGGSLSGRLTDLSGGSVSGATIRVVQRGAEFSRSTVSDASGRFQFVDLPGGQYEVTTERAGFADEKQVVYVRALQATALSMQLERSETSELPGQRLIFNAPQKSTTPSLLDAPQPSSSVDRAEPTLQMPDMVDGLTAIQEFRVMSDAYRAGLGGYMSVPGANLGIPHGELYGLAGSAIGLNWLMAPVQLPQMQYGGSAGGAINRGSSSYFVGFDQNSVDRSKLSAGMIGQPLSQKDPAGHSLVSNQLLARIDRRFGGNDTLSARYSRTAMNGNQLMPAAVPTAGLDMKQQSGMVNNTVAISPSTVNETQAQVIDGSVRLPPEMPTSGVQASVATMRRYRIYEAADNLYHQMGRQSMRMGGDFLFNQMSVAFLEQSGNASFSQSSRSAGFYAQNQWKMRPDFVVTTGARYDLQSLKGIHADTDNFAPQVGFAWAPGGSRSTVIRGGVGVMYEQFPLPVISGALDSNGAVNLTRSGRVAVGQYSSPIATLGSFATVDPMIQNAYAQQENLEVEQQLGTRTTVSASFQHVSGHALASPGYSAAALCAVAAGCNEGNEYFHGGPRYTSGSNSSYSGLSVAFAQRPLRWGDYKVSYTYAVAQSSAGQEFNELVGDQMRQVAFTGALHTSPDTAINLWQLLSHNFALSGYGDFTRRNELPGLDFIHLNAQLVKSFQLGTRARLEAVAQTFNMLEHRNYSLDKAREELGDYGVNILSSYERMAALGTTNGSQVGLRLKF